MRSTTTSASSDRGPRGPGASRAGPRARRWGRVVLAVAVLGCALPAPTALALDKVLLRDGRLVEGDLLDPPDDEHLLLRVEDAEIPIARELVAHTYEEGLEPYVPKTDDERAMLERGMVFFDGRWMSREQREKALRERAEASAAAIDALRAEQDWRNAKEVETLHFEVKSNARQEVLDDYVNRLEQYYKEFIGTWRIKVPPDLRRSKQKFFLYRNADDFYRVTKMRRGVLGFFNWVEGELHLFHDDDDYDFAISVLYHEGNHLLTFLIDPNFRYPNWMNEGMAEYYGSAVVDERGEFRVGALQYGRIVTMQNDEERGEALGLREVLTTEPGAFGARHYAVAWSFTHFLMEHKRYGKAYKTFFTKLPKHRKVDVTNTSGMSNGQSVVLTIPDLDSVVEALEKDLGRSLEELEEEWRVYKAERYSDLTANAYARAAWLTLVTREPDEESVSAAMDFYERAVDLGVTKAEVYRRYAEMLRKGGIEERGRRIRVAHSNPPRALGMIRRAIELDPLSPLNYCEAAGILVRDSGVQDFAEADAMLTKARALASGDRRAEDLIEELDGILGPVREAMAASGGADVDPRRWVVLPYHDAEAGEPEPERIDGLTTADVVARIEAGEIAARDWVFETTEERDPATGRVLGAGEQPWDLEWVPVEDVPDFARALERAP